MKHTKLSIVIAVALLFLSCSKQATTTQPPVSNPNSTLGSPTITTIAPSNVSFSSVTCGAVIVNNGGSPIKRIGLRYGVFRDAVQGIGNAAYSHVDTNTSAESCTFNIKLLVRNCKYYICANAINADGKMSFGNVDSFTTPRGIFIRDTFAGGVVFYVDSTNLHGIVYALTDQSAAIKWDNGTYINITGATGSALGTGKANTNAIITAQGIGDYAASLCRKYNGGGFNDWYLPSKIELHYMYDLIFSTTNNGYYWSSTQYESHSAWCKYYNDLVGLYMDTYPKYTTMRVRAVRSF